MELDTAATLSCAPGLPPPLPPSPPPTTDTGTTSFEAMDDGGHAQIGEEAQQEEKLLQRSSIYVQAADEMLDAVLSHEAFLFSEEEQAALKRWRELDYQTRYLFMRLFLRKHGWIRVSSFRNSYTSSKTTSPTADRSNSTAPSPPRRTPSESPALTAGADPLDSPSLADTPAEEKIVWPSDITDIDAALAELWRTVDFRTFATTSVQTEEKPAIPAETAEPVAGPSSPPRTRPTTPPPKVKREDGSTLDLTLSDSDDNILDLTHSPVRPARPTRRSAKARGKQPEVVPSPYPPVRPRTLPPTPVEEDFWRLAWSAEDLARDEEPEAVLSLLSGDELAALGKRMKVKVPTGRATRQDWTQGLLRTSNQSTLSFFAAPAPPHRNGAGPKKKGKSAGMQRSPSGSLGVGYDASGKKLTQSSVVVRQALSLIGPVIRLHSSYLLLFQRVSLVYHRTSYTAVSTSALTSSLLARFGKRRYPSYTVSRSFSIFPSRFVLLYFEKAVEIEKQLEECLDGAWAAGLVTGKKKVEKESKEEKLARYRRGADIWDCGMEEEWVRLCEEAETEMNATKDDDEKRLLYYRRRFHPGWPLARAAYKAAACYAKLGEHTREATILRQLLSQTSFRRGKRGDWYDRLALILMRYPGTSTACSFASTTTAPLDEEEEEKPKPKPQVVKGKKRGKTKAKKAQAKKEETDEDEGEVVEEGGKVLDKEKRLRLEEALVLCEKGLADPFTHLIYKSSLHRRIARLRSALSFGSPPPHLNGGKELLAKPKTRTMEGERVDTPTIGKKSVWRLSDGAEGTVEELCLEHFHSENGVLTMIFALIFWDIIFSPVDGVFETPYQSAPLDLSSDAFAVVRRPAIIARIAAIQAGQAGTFLEEVDERERPLNTWAVGTNWDRFEKQDLLEIVECMGGAALAAILTVFVEEYGHRTGGIPDLCLWNPSTHRVLFAEIKGPGDSLSETQKVWLDVLHGASAASDGSVDVEVTRVVESKEGARDSSEQEDGEEDGGGRKTKRKKGTGRERSASRSVSVADTRGRTEEIELDDV
ncbi:hypothetical protein JCM11641_002192 [Rhodosporidiobolus odoratus]